MISINQALYIRDGQYVYNYCGRSLKVHSYTVQYEKGKPINIEFGCTDINTNERFMYSYNEIYQNFEDLSDEQKLFLEWLKKDNDCIYLSIEEIKSMEKAFMNGFSYGYSYRHKHLAEEQLQK